MFENSRRVLFVRSVGSETCCTGVTVSRVEPRAADRVEVVDRPRLHREEHVGEERRVDAAQFRRRHRGEGGDTGRVVVRAAAEAGAPQEVPESGEVTFVLTSGRIGCVGITTTPSGPVR